MHSHSFVVFDIDGVVLHNRLGRITDGHFNRLATTLPRLKKGMLRGVELAEYLFNLQHPFLSGAVSWIENHYRQTGILTDRSLAGLQTALRTNLREFPWNALPFIQVRETAFGRREKNRERMSNLRFSKYVKPDPRVLDNLMSFASCSPVRDLEHILVVDDNSEFLSQAKRLGFDAVSEGDLESVSRDGLFRELYRAGLLPEKHPA